jgi:hypothetical protein
MISLSSGLRYVDSEICLSEDLYWAILIHISRHLTLFEFSADLHLTQEYLYVYIHTHIYSFHS